MKKSLLKFTAPALAVGLAFSAHGGVSAADNKVDKAEAKQPEDNIGEDYAKGSDVSHRLAPVDQKVFAASEDLVELGTELEGKERLTVEEFVYFEEQVDSIFGKLGAASNHLDAVTKQFDENSMEVIEVEVAISSAFDAARLTQQYINSLQVVEELPKVEESELPTEPKEPLTP